MVIIRTVMVGPLVLFTEPCFKPAAVSLDAVWAEGDRSSGAGGPVRYHGLPSAQVFLVLEEDSFPPSPASSIPGALLLYFDIQRCYGRITCFLWWE